MKADSPEYSPIIPDERMHILCERIAAEHDPQQFAALVLQVNALLEAGDCDCRLAENEEDSK
jgi:hypothetical protein